MISNQIMQNTIEGLHQLTKVDLAITDADGVVCASTFSDTAQLSDAVSGFAASEADSQVALGYHFFKVFDDSQLEFVILAHGDDEQATHIHQPFKYSRVCVKLRHIIP